MKGSFEREYRCAKLRHRSEYWMVPVAVVQLQGSGIRRQSLTKEFEGITRR
jgi:hypothetical protein